MSGFTTKGKQYFDGGAPIPSVTAILNDAWPKQLSKWAAETVSGYALDNWAELSALPLRERAKRMENSIWDKRDAAALRGTQIHKHGENLLRTGAAPGVPDDQLGPVQAYADFLRDFDVKPILIERPVLNRRWRYAGRPDLLAELGDGHLWLLDLKSGKALYETHVLQQAGYANAEVYLDHNMREHPWPRPERCGVVHILPDAVQLHPLAVDARAFRVFLYCVENAAYARDCRQAYTEGTAWPIGPTLRPPSAAPALEVAR